MESFLGFSQALDPSNIIAIVGIFITVIIGLITFYLMVKPTKSPKPPKPPKPTPPQPTQKNWLTIKVTQHDNDITFIKDQNNRYSIQLDSLPVSHNHKNWLAIAETLFQYTEVQEAYKEANKSKEAVHLRIMTDDTALAFLPWHCLPHPKTKLHLLDNDWVIEVGPVQANHSGFHPQILSNPLTVIPIDKEHKIAGDKHYAQIHGYLDSQFHIKGPATRVNTPKELHRVLVANQPDLIYLYAQAENGKILLDQDSSGNSITLEQLGTWLKEAEITPIVIISLITNKEISEYPKALINNTCLTWILVATHEIRIPLMEKQLFNVFEKLPQNGDITAVIKHENDHSKHPIQSIVWNSYQTPKLEISQTEQRKQQQFRAALLRVVLGREELKDRISGGIGRNINKTNMLVYAISGVKSACPFDVPAQVQNQLQNDGLKGSPVIPYYFNIDVFADYNEDNMQESIDDAISYGLLKGSPEAAVIFQQEITRRGLETQDCYIVFNWFFKVPTAMQNTAMQNKLETWIEIWMKAICSGFDTAVPKKALLIHALCLQVDTQKTAENTQQYVNQALNDWQIDDCGTMLLKLTNPLGQLEEQEISDFFRGNKLWRENLRLDKQNINHNDFAQWIHQKTEGEFEKVVEEIWTQYKQNYRQYRK
ncbi:MAG: hypothetical protein KAG86_06120 [Gammaproteobacteria bacterium]|nr:hypothetical protein [Gammaproteobacteria bacterium]